MSARRGVLPALVAATLSVSLVATLGTPLIPTIASDYGVSLESAQWVLTITLLVGAVATPIVGRLGDGRRRVGVLLGTLAAVVVGCVVAATAASFPQMLIGRALMGVGWGAAPVAIAIACDHFSGEHLRETIALLSVTVAVGTGLGFPITSAIAELGGVSAAFWAGAACCGSTLLAVCLLVPRGATSSHRIRLDLVGAALLSVALGALLLAISKGASWGWGSTRVVGLGGLALLVFVTWTAFELRIPHPMVDLRGLSQRAIVGANSIALLVGLSVYMGLTLVNRLAQTPTSVPGGLGASIPVAGLLLMPMSLGGLLSQRLARAGLRRYGFRVVLPGGALVVAATSFALAAAHGTFASIALATGLLGIGIGCTFATTPVLIAAAVPASRTASATSINQVLRNVGGSAGSALGATALTAATATGATYPADVGYVHAFAIAGVIAAAVAVISLLLLWRSGGVGDGAGAVASTELTMPS